MATTLIGAPAGGSQAAFDTKETKDKQKPASSTKQKKAKPKIKQDMSTISDRGQRAINLMQIKSYQQPNKVNTFA